MNTLLKSIGVTGVAMGLAFSGIALADKEDTKRLGEAKITLTEAITIAEQHQKGRAYEAGLEDDSFSPEYEVSVVVGDKTYEVNVDAVSGEVGKVREDRD